MTVAESWNVVVAGGGIAGCATAIGLARCGVRGVCMLSATAHAYPSLGETLPPDARLALQTLGLWDAFALQGHERCVGSCSAWGDSELGYNDFLLSPYGGGWHLDRSSFEAMLRQEAVSYGVVRLDGSKFETIALDRRRGFLIDVRGSDGTQCRFAARYVVDATGWRATLARHLGARQTVFDRLAFVYGFFDVSGASTSSRLTFLEAEEQGWWYAASLPGAKLAVALASDPKIVGKNRFALTQNWLERLRQTRHLAPRIADGKLLSEKLSVRIAPVARLDSANSLRWIAVGDAAASCDPISSQGITNALEDGLRASAAIAHAQAGGRDIAGQYAAHVEHRFADFFDNRNYFYQMERRWQDLPFWRNRLAVSMTYGRFRERTSGSVAS